MSTTTIIIGSPRNGNSAAIAKAIGEAAKEKGNSVKTFEINKMKNAKGCQSCYGCKKAGKCVVKDDLLEVLDAMRDSDSIVISTPTYFGKTSAQYKLLEDRTFSFLNGDFSSNIPAGKKVAIVQTCGSGLEGAEKTAAEIEFTWKNFFKADVVGKIVVGNMMSPDAASKDAALMAKAKEIGLKF